MALEVAVEGDPQAAAAGIKVCVCLGGAHAPGAAPRAAVVVVLDVEHVRAAVRAGTDVQVDDVEADLLAGVGADGDVTRHEPRVVVRVVGRAHVALLARQLVGLTDVVHHRTWGD